MITSKRETKTPEIRGWCPGAHRPMMSGDGLVVRVRPRLARLTTEQVLGLCAAAQRHGNGTIDLTNRANLQLRGVSQRAHTLLLDDLAALDLLDAEPGIETRRNILVQPFYQPGDLTCRLTMALLDALSDLPDLPAKFGFAVDTGKGRLLALDSADIRLESGQNNTLILRADGLSTGRAIDEGQAIDAILDLTRWFARHRTPDARRMHQVVRSLPDADTWTGATPANENARPVPGAGNREPVFGAPFGQLPADALARLIRNSGAKGLRVTPWRLFLLEDDIPVATSDFVTRSDDPLLITDACAGAPFCPQAQVATRDIARRLAPRINGTLHVSGCAKGCARPGKADVTLVGRNGRFDLVKNGHAGDEPAMRDLSAETVLTLTDLT